MNNVSHDLQVFRSMMSLSRWLLFVPSARCLSRRGEEESAENGDDDYMAGVSNREAMVSMGNFLENRGMCLS